MAAEWWIKWQMNFPVNKCKVTYAGGKKKTSLFYRHGDGVELATTIQEQDLAGHTEYL